NDLNWNNMEHDNVFYDINSDNNTSENEENFVDSSEVFNETKFNITWNPEDQFSIFENFTTIAMFTWAVEHMISKTAYYTLIQILLHPQFNKT
ncbi:15640_t:CDS:2, partial [Gigaspora rosea]